MSRGGGRLAARTGAVEKHLIETAFPEDDGQLSAVADALDLPRKTLHDEIWRHGKDPASFRRGR